MAGDLESIVKQPQPKKVSQRLKEYLDGCVNPHNAKLYGTFQERAALNITEFPKIQGSLLIRMGFVYPLTSYLVEKIGIPKDLHSELGPIVINYHTYLAGYLAYLTEIQLGLSKYPIEFASAVVKRARNYLRKSIDNTL